MKKLFILIALFIVIGCGGNGGGNSKNTDSSLDSSGSTTNQNQESNSTKPDDRYSYIPKQIDDYIAVRFLNKATFGATPKSIEHLKKVGILTWLDEQLNMPLENKNEYLEETIKIAKKFEPESFKNSIEEYLEDNSIVFNKDKASFAMTRYQNSAWFDIAIKAKDQLRKKTTYALSQIVVESLAEPIFTRRAEAISRYFDILQQNAFRSYKDLLIDISHSSSMSLYLTFNGNKKEYTQNGSIVYPDENYAREIMQLFSIGLKELNLDGTPILDKDGNTIPTYTQKDITEIARVFTGWDIKQNARYGLIGFTRGDLTHPCEFTKEYHDFKEKKVLGKTIPAGLSGDEDIEALVDILMEHKNIAPFISKILIQRLTKSNPSSEYVERVAKVFNDNGNGIKGDLKAVIKAIFTDKEFWEDIKAKKVVKFKEPLVALTQFFRAFHAKPFPKFRLKGKDFDIEDTFFFNDPSYLGQVPGRAFSVFNFYDKEFIPNDKVFQNKHLVAPEIQIQTEAKVIGFNNALFTLLRYYEKSLGLSFNGNLNWNRLHLDCKDEFDSFEKEIDGTLDRNITLQDITLKEDREQSKGETKREKALKALINELDIKLTGGSLSDEFKNELFNRHIDTLYSSSIVKAKKPLTEIYKYVIVPTIVAIMTSNVNMTE